MLIPFQFGIDIFAELERILDVKYQVFTTEGVIRELENISRWRGRSAEYARGALSFVKRVKIMKSREEDVDAELLAFASERNIICTNDKILKEKIRTKGAPVIFMRRKKTLAIDGYVG